MSFNFCEFGTGSIFNVIERGPRFRELLLANGEMLPVMPCSTAGDVTSIWTSFSDEKG
jgi:hypothetical protein